VAREDAANRFPWVKFAYCPRRIDAKTSHELFQETEGYLSVCAHLAASSMYTCRRINAAPYPCMLYNVFSLDTPQITRGGVAGTRKLTGRLCQVIQFSGSVFPFRRSGLSGEDVSIERLPVTTPVVADPSFSCIQSRREESKLGLIIQFRSLILNWPEGCADGVRVLFFTSARA